MKRIENDIYNNEMLNKLIYMKRDDKFYTLHFIYKIDSIIKSKSRYKVSKCIILSLSKNKNNKSFYYDNLNYIDLLNNDKLYEIDQNEYNEKQKFFNMANNEFIDF